MSNITAIVGDLTAITDLQSQIINELFQLLQQYITVEEAEGLSVLKKMEKADNLKQEAGI